MSGPLASQTLAASASAPNGWRHRFRISVEQTRGQPVDKGRLPKILGHTLVIDEDSSKMMRGA